MRPTDNAIFWTNDIWQLYDIIVPVNVFAVDVTNNVIKIGNGNDKWSELPTSESMMIGRKELQGNREPINNEMFIFCSSEDKWIFRLTGCFITATECTTLSTTYDKFTIIVEVDDTTTIPTGRFKMGDGINGFNVLPWFGQDFNIDDYLAGQAPVFDGTALVPTTVMTNDTLQASSTPVGKFHRDDGTWAHFEDCIFELGKFGSVIIGDGVLESDTISLTTPDGINLFIDGHKVWTQINDGDESGLDADMLDGHQSSYFSAWDHTHPVIPSTDGNLVISDENGIASDSGKSLTDVDDDALVYAIAMGG